MSMLTIRYISFTTSLHQAYVLNMTCTHMIVQRSPVQVHDYSYAQDYTQQMFGSFASKTALFRGVRRSFFRFFQCSRLHNFPSSATESSCLHYFPSSAKESSRLHNFPASATESSRLHNFPSSATESSRLHNFPASATESSCLHNFPSSATESSHVHQ